jgi:hypothetical protein
MEIVLSNRKQKETVTSNHEWMRKWVTWTLCKTLVGYLCCLRVEVYCEEYLRDNSPCSQTSGMIVPRQSTSCLGKEKGLEVDILFCSTLMYCTCVYSTQTTLQNLKEKKRLALFLSFFFNLRTFETPFQAVDMSMWAPERGCTIPSFHLFGIQTIAGCSWVGWKGGGEDGAGIPLTIIFILHLTLSPIRWQVQPANQPASQPGSRHPGTHLDRSTPSIGQAARPSNLFLQTAIDSWRWNP